MKRKLHDFLMTCLVLLGWFLFCAIFGTFINHYLPIKITIERTQ